MSRRERSIERVVFAENRAVSVMTLNAQPDQYRPLTDLTDMVPPYPTCVGVMVMFSTVSRKGLTCPAMMDFIASSAVLASTSYTETVCFRQETENFMALIFLLDDYNLQTDIPINPGIGRETIGVDDGVAPEVVHVRQLRGVGVAH